jgi:thiol-disulfide isomerase/thioredoxin
MTRGWRNLLVLVALVLAPILLHAAATSIREVVVGNAQLQVHDRPRPLKTFEFKDGSGNNLTLADFRGRYLLLNVWATWCPPCRKEMPSLDRAKRILEKETDIAVMALSVDHAGFEQLQAFYDAHGLNSLALYRGDEQTVLRALAVGGLPTTLLLDREGREIARLIGPTTWDAPDVIASLKAIPD